MSSDPYEALGVKRSSSKDEIKAAYRKLALQFHPDRDGSTEAAAAFRRVQEAADRLLKADVPHSPAAAAAAEARRSWQASRRPQQEPSFWQIAGRRRATPLLFSAACIVGGCALFVGAVQANQHLYNHNKLEAAEQRISHPTERQQQIKDLITARRAEQQMQEVR